MSVKRSHMFLKWDYKSIFLINGNFFTMKLASSIDAVLLAHLKFFEAFQWKVNAECLLIFLLNICRTETLVDVRWKLIWIDLEHCSSQYVIYCATWLIFWKISYSWYNLSLNLFWDCSCFGGNFSLNVLIKLFQ